MILTTITVITARAAWDPLIDLNFEDALSQYLLLACKPFGDHAQDIADILVNIIQLERDVLVLGLINGKPPSEIEKRNGFGYIVGTT